MSDYLAERLAKAEAARDAFEERHLPSRGGIDHGAARAARRVSHESANLKESYEGCTQVLWLLNRQWLDVIRWNRKSVTVEMAGSREAIPHYQVIAGR